jgi:shikimate kinase
MKVFLVGLPGAGKSTFGKTLAKRLQLEFFDLDHLLAEKQQLSISEIFDQYGENAFREIESRTLKHFCTNQNGFLLATGGGTPCFFDHMEFMNREGVSIFLNTSVSTVVSRVSRNDNRPLLKNQDPNEKISYLLKERLPYYSMAHFVIDESQLFGSALDQIVLKIKKAAESRFS